MLRVLGGPIVIKIYTKKAKKVVIALKKSRGKAKRRDLLVIKLYYSRLIYNFIVACLML